MKKIEGLKKYCLLLNEDELNICKRSILKLDIRNIDIVSNSSKLLRYLVRLGAYCAGDVVLDDETRDLLRKD